MIYLVLILLYIAIGFLFVDNFLKKLPAEFTDRHKKTIDDDYLLIVFSWPIGLIAYTVGFVKGLIRFIKGQIK